MPEQASIPSASSPAADAADPSTQPSERRSSPGASLSRLELPCPCGRRHSLAECCLPVAQRLRSGPDPTARRPSPFDEIRASCALLLWGLLSQDPGGLRLRALLSGVARRLWGVVLAGGAGAAGASAVAAPRGAAGTPTDGAPTGGAATGGSAAIASDEFVSGVRGRELAIEDRAPGRFIPEIGVTGEDDAAYGHELFERAWGATEPGTRSWLLGNMPAYVRCDPLVGELALDWLLWDEPWLRGQPAGGWLLRNRAFGGKQRVRRTGEAILRSRVGLWELEETVPAKGMRLRDRASGRRVLLHTAATVWPDPDRLVLARVYAFGRWRLVAGRCVLLGGDAADDVLGALRRRAAGLGAPPPSDPRWAGWVKSNLLPVMLNRWLADQLALPSVRSLAAAMPRRPS